MIDKQSSKLCPIKWGVPQGSTFGLLLFILYINDLGNCTLVKPRLFADDMCLVHSADTIDNLSKLVNQDMVNVSNWMQANRLCINSEKSNLLIIPPKFNSPSTSPEINIFYLMGHLSPSPNQQNIYAFISMTSLTSKQTSNFSIRSSLGHWAFSTKSLLHLYFALFHSHLLYCAQYGFPLTKLTRPPSVNSKTEQ